MSALGRNPRDGSEAFQEFTERVAAQARLLNTYRQAMNLKFTDHPAGGGVSERKIGNGDVTIQDFKNAQLDMIRLLSGDKIGDYLVTRVDVEFRHRARGADGAETTDLIFPADDPAQLPGWDGRDAIISSVIVRGLVTHAHGGSTHDYSSKSSSSGA